MKYVLDSSVAVKWFVAEADSDRAARLRDSYVAGTDELIAPSFFPIEVAHAVTREERVKKRPGHMGAAFITDLMDVLPVLHDPIALCPRAYELSAKYWHGFYDCIYVALAEREGCPLVTADQKMLDKFAADFPFIVRLASL